MHYEIFGPTSIDKLIEREHQQGGRFSTAAQTIEILKDNIPIESSPFSLFQEMFFNRGGFIVTSTPVKSIPRDGIYVSGKKVSFDFPSIYKSNRRNALFSNAFLSTLLSGRDMENFHQLLRKSRMKLSFDGGKDSGYKWDSRIMFDIDYNEDFLELRWDAIFLELGDSTFYGFLV